MLNGIIFSSCSSSKIRIEKGQLTVDQRYTIQTLKQERFTQSEIAKRIDRDKSVVCRELKRNSDQRSYKYSADLANRKAINRHKIKKKKVRFTTNIQNFVDKHLKKLYSPEQIVGIAKLNNIECVSAERIYQYIWEDKKKGGSLYKFLRTKGKSYRKRGDYKDSRGIIPNKVGIDKRPEIVNERRRVGDLEIDLVIGKNHKRQYSQSMIGQQEWSKLHYLIQKKRKKLKKKQYCFYNHGKKDCTL